MLSGEAAAKVKGQCYFCHTMHNSQDAGTMVVGTIEGVFGGTSDCQGCHAEPLEGLVRYTCIGCHAMNATSGDGIATLGGYNIPQVFYADKDGTKELAAGNFKHSAELFGNYNGHDVHGFFSEGIFGDFELVGIPPGYSEDMDPSSVKYNSWPYGFSLDPVVFCAGAYGCHGNRNIESQTIAMAGTHHADDSVLQLDDPNFDQGSQGLSPGTSYRYLSGVKGGEDSDWEYTQASDDHNEYYGENLGRTGVTSQTSVETMSEFCASCHGLFHMSGTTDGTGISPTESSPWIRHPTDVAIPDAAPYNTYVTYALTARVARTDLDVLGGASAETLISGGSPNAIVFCLTCHKAHATNQPDILRYTYDDITTGGSSSSSKFCFACHTIH
jgi:hypothetical protein